MLEKSVEKKEPVPEYIWSFFDLSGGFNYHRYSTKTKAQLLPWIQKQITGNRLSAIQKRMKQFKFNEHIATRKGSEYVTDGMDLEDKVRLNEYYDSYLESTSWSVLSLFVHRTIRKVGKGLEDDNKYCFWPLSQPWVNHRPIDLGLIGGDGGYVDSLSSSTNLVWSSQQGFSLPYCVSNKIEGTAEQIEMEFMINSGESKTNAEVYVQETDSNSPAGNVNCVGLDNESLIKCIKMLQVSFKSLNDVQFECFLRI
jgi:hypothetical protein